MREQRRKQMEVFTLAKTKISSPVDFEKLDTATLFQYAYLYKSRLKYGSPMIDYYTNMLELVNFEIGRRAELFEKSYK
ncbi:hypothetical protein AVV02_gp247 [Bacillus phage AvesoBmore]|uniref:Uncharacterized protein n=1 Tax=Bacillus phage AvesoBmore TaxID=1698451 RepID=A0A0K2D116_9CAUD|nr:hypothetical protein AVV02_gp247 [Bacillus phage AvesoBmore]ALA13418.1 hypothetical protein AVESOBMORE_247 [Bacillus phage AvesoBmore]